jgi:pimeloyl-CoA synthetase
MSVKVRSVRRYVLSLQTKLRQLQDIAVSVIMDLRDGKLMQEEPERDLRDKEFWDWWDSLTDLEKDYLIGR